MKFWIIVSLLTIIAILFITYLLYKYYTRAKPKKKVTFKIPEATIMNNSDDMCKCEPCPDGTVAQWDEDTDDCCAYKCE